MRVRYLTTAFILAAVLPLAAAQQQTTESDLNLKQQIRTFEQVLRRGVENAGERLAQAAQQRFDVLRIGFQADPIVSGIYNPGIGPHFDVQIPRIEGTALSLMEQMKPKPELAVPVGSPKPDPAGGVTEANTASKPVANTVVKDDPMTVESTKFNATKLYTDFTLESLKDAMLDYSNALQIKDGERLTVMAREMEFPGLQNSLLNSRSRKLVLYIKGEDLAAFRAGKINRDEAKERIVDYRF